MKLLNPGILQNAFESADRNLFGVPGNRKAFAGNRAEINVVLLAVLHELDAVFV